MRIKESFNEVVWYGKQSTDKDKDKIDNQEKNEDEEIHIYRIFGD